MSQTKEERLAAVHQRAMTRFDAIQSALRDERMQCLQDRRFYSIAGAQWEGPLGEQFENKPKFEMNKVHLSVIRIINEYRNNRISVDFTPKDGAENDQMSDTCDGLYRADEQDSNADEAKDNAFEEAVGGGFGAWRLRACYEDDEDDDDDRQRIRWEPIFDADSCVFFDLDAKRQDKADAKWCFVLNSMTLEAYKEEYGDDPTAWPKEIHMREFDWCTPNVVYVAEYYEIEQKTELIHIFRGLVLGADGEPEEMRVPDSELKDDPTKEAKLQATGFREVRQKRIKRTKVHKYQLSGASVLDDEGFIAGSCIPIIPVFGKRWFVDNIERCMGHVRLARDAQMLINMLMSWLAEIASRFDMEKPIVTPAQMAGHTTMWSEDNVKKYPYLLLNEITDASGQTIGTNQIAYTKAPNIPPAMAALLQIAEQSLQDLLGNQAAGEQIQPNISGKVVELIQNRLDMQVFIYMSNMSKAVKRSGEVWISMMRDIAVEEDRKMKTIGVDGKVGSVQLLTQAMGADGEQYLENDFSRAKLDVNVEVGPSSSSLRNSIVRSLTAIASVTADPETKQALTLATIANIEGEGLSDLREWARAKAIRMGVLKPTKEEDAELKQEQQTAQPDPNAEYLKAAAEEAVSKSTKARADSTLALAKAEQTQAETAKIIAQTGTEHQNQIIDAVKAVTEASTPPPSIAPLG